MAEEPSKIKLVHITTVPQSLNFIRGQVEYMKNRGFDVSAISSPGQNLWDFGQAQEITVYPVEMPRSITPFHDLQAVWRLSRILRDIKPTIVHAHTPKGGLLGMISAWHTRTPIRIYNIHGLPYMTATGRKRTLLKTTERVACMLADKVFCVSHSIREVAIADGIVPAEKIEVLAGGTVNGVDADVHFNPDRFSLEEIIHTRAEVGIGEHEVVLGFVGRVVRDKGIEELACAWKTLREDNPHARLVLVGPLEPQDPVSPETIGQLAMDERVCLVDFVEDTSPYFSVFDMLVLPTYREGFGNVNIEAASMGMPVVSSDIPGCVDSVQNGVTGTLVPAGDAEALAEAIQMYLDDPALRRRHGEAGRQRVLREFRQEVIWEAIYQEYCSLLIAKGLAVPKINEEPARSVDHR